MRAGLCRFPRGLIVAGCLSLIALAGPAETPTPTPGDPIGEELAATLKMISAHKPLRTPEVADPQSASNRDMLEALIRLTMSQGPRNPDHPCVADPDEDSLPGTLSGSFSVDNKGAGTYETDLPIPEARSSPSPRLTISCQNDWGTSALGQGFYYTTGFHHSITRGRSLLARDDLTRGTEIGDRDKFYLDGKRLVCVTGPETYGRPGSVYRTEVDSFSRIVASGSGDMVETFVIDEKDGDRFTFGRIGGMTDGMQSGFDEDTGKLANLPKEYAIKRVEDRLGNYVTFSYEHRGFGEWVLKEIDYTGGTRVKPPFAIQFEYAPDRPTSVEYQAGLRFDHRQLIKSIRIRHIATNEIVAEYVPEYAPLGDDRTPRIRKLGGSFSPDLGQPRDKLPPMRFEWSTGPVPTALWREFAVPPAAGKPGAVAAPILADFDGDGRDDVLVLGPGVSIARSTKAGFNPTPVEWLDAKTIKRELHDATAWRVHAGDFDCDGKSDLLIAGDDGWIACWRSTGLGFDRIMSMDASAMLSPTGADEALARIGVGDFNGDGRSDILIHAASGRMHQLISYGAKFIEPDATAQVAPTLADGNSMGRAPAACEIADFNYDGNDDYLWLETSGTPPPGTTVGVTSLYLAFALPEGGFGKPIRVHEWSGDVALRTGDFNYDDLPDFLIGERADTGRWIWTVLLNRGQIAGFNGNVDSAFTRVPSDLPEIGEIAPIRSQVSASRGGSKPPGFEPAPPVDIDPGLDLICIDANRDGLTDVLTRTKPQDDTNTDRTGLGDTGWNIHLAVGDGTFAAAKPLVGRAWKQMLGDASRRPGAIRISRDNDIDGDGLFEWITTVRDASGWPRIATALSGAGERSEAYPRFGLITGVVDGLGKTLDIAYRAGKDDAIYVAGTPVAYPIKTLRSNRAVVSDIWRDAGGTSYSQYSYHYAGNHTDMSGRGTMGFVAFTTLDQQTGFIKYQFLAHSFPMTGLTVQDQTLRAWRKGSHVYLEMVKATNNTVVFDAVRDPSTGRLTGTVFPFISRVLTSTWDNDLRSSFNYDEKHPDAKKQLFDGTLPIPPTWVAKESHWFDLQDTDKPVRMKQPVVECGTIIDEPADRLARPPNAGVFAGAITFGNETAVATTHLHGFYKNVNRSYYLPSEATDTLADRLKSEVISEYLSTKDGVINHPSTTYEYFRNTDLLSKKLEDLRNEKGEATGAVTETLYLRDNLGRLVNRLKRDITPGAGGESSFHSEYMASDFNDETDMPARVTDPDDGEEVKEYNTLFRDASSVLFDNGARALVTHDGLNRMIDVFYPNSKFEIHTEYAWTSAAGDDWRQTQVVPSPRISPGVTGRSVYAVRVTRRDQPTKTEYHDRMDRVIRVVIEDEDGTKSTTDTVFDDLDREVFKSEPYSGGDRVTWEQTVYDVYGNVSETKKLTRPAPKP